MGFPSNNHQETVSVILTVFNGAQFLQETLNCLWKNREFLHQIIVLDDASRDDSPDIIAKNHSLFDMVVYHTNNVGVAKTRQEGVRLATGTWIHILDQDDLFPPGFYQHARDLFPSYDLILSEMVIRNSLENRVYKVIDLDTRDFTVESFLLDGSPAPTQSQILGRRELFVQHRFLSYPGSDDSDFLLRTFEKKPKVGVFKGYPVQWRWHRKNSSYDTATNPGIMFQLLDHFGRDFPQYLPLLRKAKGNCLKYAATLRKKVGRPWLKMALRAARFYPKGMFSRAGFYLLIPETVKVFLRKLLGKRPE